MSYESNKLNPSPESNYFLILKPRKRLTDVWVSVGSNVWKKSVVGFEVLSFTMNGATLLSVDTTPTVGTYQVSGGFLFIYSTVDPNADPKVACIQFPLYLSTKFCYAHKVPTNDGTDEVYFEGYVKSVPTAKASMSDVIFGALSVQSSAISLINADGRFSPYFYECSMNQTEFEVYHCLGDIKPENCRLTFSGYCFDLTITDESVDIRTTDQFGIFDRGFDGEFITQGPSVGLPVQQVWGVKDGLRLAPAEIDPESGSAKYFVPKPWPTYVLLPPDGSGNEYYGYGEIHGSLRSNLTAGVGANTKTKTFCGYDDDELQIGDRVVLFESWSVFTSLETGYEARVFLGGNRSETVEITSIGGSGTGKYIEHAELDTPMASSSYLAFNQYVRRLDLFIDGISYHLFPLKNYTVEYVDDPQVPGFQVEILYDTLETSNYPLDLPRAIESDDIVYARIYGKKMNLIETIKDVLAEANIADEKIDQDAFDDLIANEEFATATPSLVVPEVHDGEFPTIREILGQLLFSGLVRLVIDQDRKWTIQKLATISAAVKSFTEYELKSQPVTTFEFSYGDILSDIVVEYNSREISDNPMELEGRPQSAYAKSDIARGLHGIVRQKTFQSFFRNEVDAQNLADKLSWIFGDRKGHIQISTSFDAVNLKINEVVEILRERIPGVEFAEGQEGSRMGSIVDIDIGPQGVVLTLDDQKGFDGQGQ